VIAPEYFGAIQANIFDGKSVGKNPMSILLQRFTVTRSGRQGESLQIEAYSQLRIAELREFMSYSAGILRCPD
jgi:hypothetical protein